MNTFRSERASFPGEARSDDEVVFERIQRGGATHPQPERHDRSRKGIYEMGSVRVFLIIIIGVVVIAIVGGFFVIDSPSEARARREDENTLSTLRGLQYSILDFFRLKNRLPLDQTELLYFFNGKGVVNGKVTYKSKSNLSFLLCGEFLRENVGVGEEYPMEVAQDVLFPASPIKEIPAPRQRTYRIRGNWDHSKGLFCFDRTIEEFAPEKH